MSKRNEAVKILAVIIYVQEKRSSKNVFCEYLCPTEAIRILIVSIYLFICKALKTFFGVLMSNESEVTRIFVVSIYVQKKRSSEKIIYESVM